MKKYKQKYNPKYYLNNKEIYKIRSKKYRQANREKIRIIHKKWRDKNLIHVRKMGRISRNKYYYKHRDSVLLIQNISRSNANVQAKKQLLSILNRESCERCGYKEFSCSLDIHHINPSQSLNKEAKKGSFYRLRGLIEQAKIHPESLKVLCANCHRAISCRRLKEEVLKFKFKKNNMKTSQKHLYTCMHTHQRRI